MLQFMKRRSRLLPAILFLIWCVAVTTLWNQYASLVPSRKTDMPADAVVAFDRIHNLVAVGNRDRRDKNYFIVELPSGRTLSKLELEFDAKHLSFVNDSWILLAEAPSRFKSQSRKQPTGQWTTAFDVRTGKNLWSMPNVQSGSWAYAPENATRLLQRLPPPDRAGVAQNASSQPLSQIIDARTGEVLPLFGILTGANWLIESPDHRWVAIVSEPSGWTVYDAHSGQVAFTAPKMNPIAISFSPDSTEFRVRRRASESEFSAFVYDRFRVTDGAVLEAHSGPIDQNGYITDDGRLELHFCLPRLLEPVNRWNVWLSRMPYLRRLPMLQRPEPYNLLIDHSRNKILGALPVSHNGALLTNESLTLLTYDSILYYIIPPRRRWGVLLTGLLAPLVIILGAAGFRRLVRRSNTQSLGTNQLASDLGLPPFR